MKKLVFFLLTGFSIVGCSGDGKFRLIFQEVALNNEQGNAHRVVKGEFKGKFSSY